MTDTNKIREVIAIKHGTLLGENDPLLMTVTINELMLEQFVEMLAAKNAEYVKSVDASIQKGIAESKALAGRVITEGSNYGRDQIKEAIASSIAEGGTKYLAAQNELLQKAEEAKKSAFIAAGVSVICLIATMGLIWTI